MGSEDELDDRIKARERRALSAHAVHEALRSEGASEIERPWNALAWSGLAAGISIGLSLVAQGVLRAHLPDTTWRPLVTSVGYTVGFVVVTLGRQQLFTETTLTACLPLLHAPSWHTVRAVVRLWVVVLAANLLGGGLFAWTAAQSSVFDPELRAAFADIAREAIAHEPWSAFVRAIVGGWIIALMVWLQPSAASARPWIIAMMTYLIAAAGLTHVIAGSVDVFYGMATAKITLASYLWRFAMPVLAGNSLGGIVLVAIVNHAQVAASPARHRD